MLIYTSKFINVISLIISVTIYLLLNFFINNQDFKISKFKFQANFISNNNLNLNSTINSSITEKVENKNTVEENWYIQIDKIGLKAPIQEGTTQEIMEDYVGHFEESSKTLGNVCLAAHNRGYKNNYFSRLKELKEGDEIKYKYNNMEKLYVVTEHIIIEDTDWTRLQETDENMITLITCVENEPKYRRCIQGIEEQ